VTNTGPLVPPDQIPRLLQPFQRIASDRVGDSEGLGLGLSIVAAIANAHGAVLDVSSRDEGGLDVTVCFAEPISPNGSASSLAMQRGHQPSARKG
jgi:signal transduction histidine kinase